MSDGKRFSVAAKAEALKKAGFHPVVTVVILVLSTPGFYEFFFDKTGDVANRKADVAYEVLAKEIEHLREDDKRLEREIQNIRNFILMSHAARMGVAVAPLDGTTEAMAESDAVTKDEGASALMGADSAAETGGILDGSEQGIVPVLRSITGGDDSPVKEREELPELEDMIK